MRRVFADTSYFIAMIVPNDALHDRAKAVSAEPLLLVTTGFVLTELAAYLSDPANRELFNALLERARSSPSFEFVPTTSELFDAGAELYAQRSDKSWSLVDCISFIVMERGQLTEALTGDHHFQQAGFKALLIDDSDASS
jgi:predicted nucleic acid-binding protein